MPTEEFKQWFEKETSNQIKPLDKEAIGLIDDVKKKTSQVQEACRGLIKECDREIEKGKAYHRARVAKRLAQFFIDTFDKIAFPEHVSFKTTELLVRDLKKTFSSIERERNIWFPRISPLFIMARRKIDVVLSKAFESIDKLDSFTFEKYVKAKTIMDCFIAVDNIAELQKELGKIEREKNDTEHAVSSVNREMEETKQKILSIQRKDEMKELMEISHQARELDRKVKQELRYLQKPFIKLQNLYHSGDVSVPTEEIDKITQYLTRPFSALAKEEQGYPVCKRILRKITETIEQDKLKIKTSRQKKAQDQIDTILKNDALISLQKQCKDLYDRRKQLVAKGNIANFKNEITALKTSLNELERQKEHFTSKLSNLQSHHKEKKDKLELRKKELEKNVLEITKKNVRFSI